jgi:3-hydroxyacyl-CoA dehydrogenase/enoyl-CoA hydratase/3-hydroxybutyryl-CoA epimerase
VHAINAFRHFHSKKMVQSTSFLNRREIHFDKGQNGIATISFSEPGGKVNVLSLATLETFSDMLTQTKESGSKALVVNIENCAGADLKMILKGLDDPILLKKIVETGHRVFDQLAHLPIPTIALIDKACLGGALELALACEKRVVTNDPKTILGFPEIRLGLFPCWGGTQRAPRLVGGPQALNLIMNGETVSASQAREMQLADGIFSREVVQEKGREFLEFSQTPEGKKQLQENREKILHPSWPGFAEERYRGPPARLACKLMYLSHELPLEKSLVKEMQYFLGMPSEAMNKARNLVSAFLEKKPPFSAKE